VSTRRVDRSTPFHAKGRCHWCNAELTGRQQRWCSQACVEARLVRISPSYVTQRVAQRDYGVCARCHVDTRIQKRAWMRLRDFVTRHWRRLLPYASVVYVDRFASQKYGVPEARLHSNWWDADHIVPVVEGGGGCGLENYRTLCLKCHKEVTAELKARRAATRQGEYHPRLWG
jgi:hypothetical protein